MLGAGTAGLTLAQTAGIIGTFTDTTGYALSRGINVGKWGWSKYDSILRLNFGITMMNKMVKLVETRESS